MSKYLTVYKNSLSSFLQYRLNLGLILISQSISLSGLLYIWIAIYSGGQTVGSYTLTGILTYYLVLTLLRTTISEGVGMGFEVVNDINDGVITNYLLKPFSYPLEKLVKLFGQATINTLFMAPIAVLIGFLLKNYINLPSLTNFIQFIGLAFIALIFYYLIYFLTALSSFWVTHGGNFIYATIIISNFLNGGTLPLDLFPAWYQSISIYLPFQYLLYIPIQGYFGNIENWLFTLSIALVWIIIFIIITKIIWKMGIKKFEAVGR